MSVVTKYAEFAVACKTSDLSADVFHHAKRVLIDWFACTLPGGLEEPATLIIKALTEDIGRGNSSLLPGGEQTTTRTAALINGTAAHIIEFDDIYRDGLFHPGAPIIASALATAEKTWASGEELLRAIIAGYEVANRIAEAVNPHHYEWWHTTATVGFFGSATSAAMLLGLDLEKTAHALATAGTMAAGLQQAFRADAMSKPIHSGRAAEGGVLAALMAKNCVTGALDILEGERGFGKAMSANVNWRQSIQTLGSDYTITRMTQKNHAACGHVHAIIDAIIHIKNVNRVDCANVKNIRIGSYQKAYEICHNTNPKTPYEAKFSAEYCTAIAIQRGCALRANDFVQENLKDPSVQRVMKLVNLEIDEQCQSVFPKVRSANVELETIDGRVFNHFSPTRKGDPDNPLLDSELSDKYADLVEPVVGKLAAGTLLSTLWSVKELISIKDLKLDNISR
ncbi:MmgE/PrpD family protein [Rhodospirillaceae bacterium]|nr:MmgE/PrpD family protein [Rhodospirillaceae bacterium]MBT7733018.1 MmgE/PrpD family protein [Rhodospirillaceae bacterium]MDC0999024.1 MmgE/PrpD family protein [Alphaproteobacteria bacterium]MDC1442322.1 MmgE/PrpD family protein [Rhodospirillaceae bacterium]